MRQALIHVVLVPIDSEVRVALESPEEEGAHRWCVTAIQCTCRTESKLIGSFMWCCVKCSAICALISRPERRREGFSKGSSERHRKGGPPRKRGGQTSYDLFSAVYPGGCPTARPICLSGWLGTTSGDRLHAGPGTNGLGLQ